MPAPGNPSRVNPITAAVKEVVSQWREISAIPSEFRAFGRAVTSMANDLGLSPAEFRALAAKGANARQLASLLDALRIDVLALAQKQPDVLRDMRRTCTVCDRKSRCDRNIASKAVAEKYYTYCANAAILNRLQQDHRFNAAAHMKA